jgi:hypothetical protein
MLKPTINEINFKDARKIRQKENNQKVYDSLISNDEDNIEFHKKINSKELERLLEDLPKPTTTIDALREKCRENDLFAIMVSRTISINASRQGTKDEEMQIQTCAITAAKCGIHIHNLTTTALRPTKDGRVIQKHEMKIEKIPKDACLKSFDAEMTGKINGYISAKVVYGSGGHQDNVLEELDVLAEWWCKFGKENQMLVLLIDTDLHNKVQYLIEKYTHNPWIRIFSHILFQEYMIDTFYEAEVPVEILLENSEETSPEETSPEETSIK